MFVLFECFPCLIFCLSEPVVCDSLTVMALHSKVTTNDQARVFEKPRCGYRKVICFLLYLLLNVCL